MRIYGLFFSMSLFVACFLVAMDDKKPTDDDNKKNDKPLISLEFLKKLESASVPFRYGLEVLSAGHYAIGLGCIKHAHDTILTVSPHMRSVARCYYQMLYEQIVSMCGQQAAFHGQAFLEGGLNGLKIHAVYAPSFMRATKQAFGITQVEATPGAPDRTWGDIARAGVGIAAGIGAHYVWQATMDELYGKDRHNPQTHEQQKGDAKKPSLQTPSFSLDPVESFDDESILSRLKNFSGKTLIAGAAYLLVSACLPQHLG